MTTLDLDALQAAAEAATPGPWDASRNLDWAFPRTDVITLVGGRQIVRFVDGEPQFWCTTGKAEQEWANAAFIALANPVAVLALIDRLRKAEAVREGYMLVPINVPEEVIVAIENQIDIQLVASAMNPAEMFRQDGEDVWDAAIAAIAAPTSADSEGAKG